jgi:hypothetical protein
MKLIYKNNIIVVLSVREFRYISKVLLRDIAFAENEERSSETIEKRVRFLEKWESKGRHKNESKKKRN